MIEQYLKGLKVPKDELTAIERNKLLNEGKDVDRIMCCIDSGETLAPLIGCTLPEYYFSAEKMCELEEYIYNKFHSDGAGLSTTLRGMAEAMGSKIKYSDYNIAQLETPAISSLDEVDKLKRINVDEDGRLPIILKGLKMVKERLGDKVPVSGTVTGPFTVASMLVGTENLLKGMVKQPDKVLQMMDIITENNNRYIQRLLDMGVGVGFADPVSSTSLLRVKQYEKFSLPFFQKNVDFIKSQGGGCGLHICGTSRKLWELLIPTGIGTFGPDNVEDMAEAKEVLGPYMCIQGNVPPVEVMRLGTPYDVLRASRESIRKAYDSPKGFVLTSGCQTPMFTPEENMTALMDAARIFGHYPINQDLLWMEDQSSILLKFKICIIFRQESVINDMTVFIFKAIIVSVLTSLWKSHIKIKLSVIHLFCDCVFTVLTKQFQNLFLRAAMFSHQFNQFFDKFIFSSMLMHILTSLLRNMEAETIFFMCYSNFSKSCFHIFR